MRCRLIIAFLTLLGALILPMPSVCAAPPTKSVTPTNPQWSYDDDYNGQEDWGNLKGYEVCNTGSHQSPIAISYTKIADLPPLNFSYKSAKAKLETTDKSFIVNLSNAGTISDAGNIYNLQRIEFHSPSEHVTKGSYYPLEIHLIHKNKNGKFLIAAVFANIGAGNPAIAALLIQLKSQITAKTSTEQSSIDARGLLPEYNPITNPNPYGYYAYDGSLPYPPCTEGVKWRIIKSPITISKSQLAEITAIISRNTRLPQPVYMRGILESKE